MKYVFLKIWWHLQPSVNIVIYYRIVGFVQGIAKDARPIFLRTAFDQCSLLEQRYITEVDLMAPDQLLHLDRMTTRKRV